MSADGYALFDTAIGPCAVAWSMVGVCALRIPEPNREETRERLLRRYPHAVEKPAPAGAQHVIDGVVALLEGGWVDFSDCQIDVRQVPLFARSVYELTSAIPPGHTRTYGDIAEDLGDRGLARAVGQALGHNPVPIVVPCHRVIAANGRTGGFSAPGGVATKQRLLEMERVHANPHTLV